MFRLESRAQSMLGYPHIELNYNFPGPQIAHLLQILPAYLDIDG